MTDPQHCRGSIKHRLSFAARLYSSIEIASSGQPLIALRAFSSNPFGTSAVMTSE